MIGMNVSLFERMLKLYPDLHNLLKIQYRMNEEIVKYPNEKFYLNSIENDPSIKNLINEDFNSKFNWPNKNIPLLFVHVEGEEEITKFKSKRNDQEAKIVALFVKKLNNLNIDFKNIGIITPYVAQKMLIEKELSKELEDEDFINLHISSIDAFQGREKDFIIISNVRSNPYDNIGFLSDYKRLNASITRAKYGMIVIGNVNCLSNKSQIWSEFIKYYSDKGLLVEPEKKEKLDNYDKIIKYNINKLNKKDFKIEYGHKNNALYQEKYIFIDYQIDPCLNEDLLKNFECCENVYANGNNRYYIKKKEKNNKYNKNNNKKKKKQAYYY
jgi:superfamily I DNA and/or RNA helicase